jgi:hypothetical protein
MAVFWDVLCLVWHKFTDISEVLAASIIRHRHADDGGNK